MQKPVIESLLDTDMYKLTMHAAVVQNFPDVETVYKYTNRSAQLTFTEEAVDWLKKEIESLGNLKITTEEIEFLKKAIPFLPEEYLDYLSNGRLSIRPDEQIELTSEPADQDGRFDIKLEIRGLWRDTILYEIPLLSLISEAYFRFVDTDWNYDNQVENAYQKARTLIENGINFSEFGSRRRRSRKTQDLVMTGIMKAVEEQGEVGRKCFAGTSNVLFAKKYGVKPIGTVAHEWMMAIASITMDYVNANKDAMDYWIKTFGGENAGLALTDTFGTDNFLRSFNPPYSDYYIGVRQDSGDPEQYTKKIAHHYIDVLKYPRFSKVICYSDSLNPEKAIGYAQTAHKFGLKATFGIGTNFTNDFYSSKNPNEKSEPLNIVIKLLEVNGNHAIKISDNMGKNMGDPDTVRKVKEELGYIERTWVGDNEAHRWTS
ncbi:LANO_0H14532g1_1 [Lachancea nothofagi CBS 11611]|uniref:Nicotinate phosphoribosyltransferase n=1 Tax=Lachancea nothofagi CBS 11611 TaxID=1266666 RepID=A0A1G4KMM5_9SACH|nr:LANO_0H14532g1_1 [Lachancea nothofagi CBS 11611]